MITTLVREVTDELVFRKLTAHEVVDDWVDGAVEVAQPVRYKR